MGFVDDPSAVGWNPALLGLRSQTDFLVAAQHDSAWKTIDGYALFAKASHFALGYVTKFDSLRPAQIYGGFGLSMNHERSILIGASAMYQLYDQADLLDKLRLQASGMYAPLDYLWISLGISNIHRASRDCIVASAAAAAAPLTWLGVHLSLDIASKEELYGHNADLQAGITVAPWSSLVLSGMYNPVQKLARVGVEFQPGFFGIGEAIAVPQEGPYTGVLTLRLSQDEENFDLPHYVDVYGSNRDGVLDAGCRDAAYRWADARSDDTPQQIFTKMGMASSDYSSLRRELHAISPDTASLFAEIGKLHYGIVPPPPAAETPNPSLVRLREGYHITVDSLAEGEKEGTVVFRVADRNGRNVGGLARRDVRLADTTFAIQSFSQVASQKRVAADIVVLMDCSGSMSAEITQVRANVEQFALSLANRNIDARLGCVLYGEKIYDVLQPTPDVNAFLGFYAKAAATGRDEVTSTAIMTAATQIDYRSDAARVAVMITDDCAIQDNADYSEPDCIEKLWKAGVRLYGVVNTKNHNAGFATRLTLGRDYEITDPFNAILDEISGDITTTYRVQYRKRPPAPVPVTVVRGVVKSENGWKLAARLDIVSDGARQAVATNPLDGQYAFEAKKGSTLSITAAADDHIPGMALVTVPATTTSDTIVRDFVLKQSKTIVKGVIRDETGRPIAGTVRVENAQTLGLVTEGATDAGGAYRLEIAEGLVYRLTPSVKEYIPTPSELDMRGVKKGSTLTQDLTVVSIPVAAERGMTFKLKNLFFDSGKWDLRPESAEELTKLVQFLTEYQSVRIEIGAHTDNVGKHDANQILSQRRAQSVVDYVTAHGIDQARLAAVGYAETVPVADNATPEGRQLNRRVEFKIIK